MKLSRRLRFAGIWGVWVMCIAGQGVAVACPFCNPNITLTESIDQAHACYAVTWVAGVPGNPDLGEPGTTQVRIEQVFKAAVPGRGVGELLTLPHYSAGQAGERSLLFGHLRDGEVLSWDGLTPCSDALADYLGTKPGREVSSPARLPFFLDFLEHGDEDIAVDAYSEFANASFADVRSIAARFPREKLVEWVSVPAKGTGRIARVGFYGMVLGLCGGDVEAKALEKLIRTPGEDFRIGIDGVMAGYLQLRGEAGLTVLKEHAFAPETPSSEAYALQQAVRFIGEYATEGFSQESLRSALRPMVDDPQFAELALVDLARWEDLSLVDLLIERYSDPDFANLPTQTAIVRYYLAISELDPTGRSESEQKAIERAGLHLATLKERDPEVVEHAGRFLPSEVFAETPAPGKTEPPILAVPAAMGDAPGEMPRGRAEWALWAAGLFAVGVVLRQLWRSRSRPTA